MCYFIMLISTRSHTWTHTLYVPHVPWFQYFLAFLRGQQHGVLKIDLVSEAENVYSLCSLCSLVKATEFHPAENTHPTVWLQGHYF